MRSVRTTTVIAIVALLSAIAVLPAAAGGDVLETMKGGAASTVEVGLVEALPRIERSFTDFISPLDPDPSAVAWDGPRLEGVAAVTLDPGAGGLGDLSSMETLTGPDGDFLARVGFEIQNHGDVAFYTTRPEMTLYLASFTAPPVAPDEGVLGVSLAFTWSGEETLAGSFFPSDPLIGYAHSVEFGTVAGDPFDVFTTVNDQAWTRYTNPLLTFGSGPIVRDRSFLFGWVVPGVPDDAGVTLSYATDPYDPATLITQHIRYEQPERVEFLSLSPRFADLTQIQQNDLENRWVVVAGGDPETTTTVATDEEEPGQGDGSVVVVLDDGGNLGRWLALLIVILLFMGGIWVGRRSGWFDRVLRRGPTPTMPESLDWDEIRRQSARGRDGYTRVVVDVHHRSGGAILDGRWIAPTHRTISDARLTGDDAERSEEWSGHFIDIKTLEWVDESSPVFEELRTRFIRPPATEFDDGVGPIA